ncbi:MAG: transcriptional repressor [Candidatus Curtissbacteria bacterium]|nr:transcriptional repressor [Candidatus Curtissbacteria bacterium]
MIQIKHDCREELREADLKATPARLGILQALEHTSKPLDVNSLISYLKRHNIKADDVTVFRIMHMLSDRGLVTPLQLGEGKFRYEHSGREDHHHFICESCGSIEDVSDCNINVIEKEIQKKKGFLVKRHSLEFFGICKSCRH